MDFITILRELWTRRVAVVVVAVVAVVAGLLVAYQVSVFPPELKGRERHVGLGSTLIFLDTPDSQVVDLNPKGGDALNPRAALIANLMATGPVKAAIARTAGIPASELIATTPSAGEGPAQAPSGDGSQTELEQRAATSAAAASYNLTFVSDGQVPIVTVESQAPDAQAAAKLANAAVSGLKSYLTSVAARGRVPATRKLIVQQLGAARSADVTRGGSRLYGLLATIGLFVLGCGAIVLVSAGIREWRRASALERTAGPEADEVDEQAPDRRSHSAVGSEAVT